MIRLRSLFPALLAVALCPACGRDDAPALPRTPPGIVLFCFDTLRADAVGPPRPGEAPSMPALHEFCSGSTWFEDASASSSWTAPSVTTLLTGLHPRRHGVQGESQSLVPAVTTLAERLAEAGWHTAAFTGGGWVGPAAGLSQGFEKGRFLPTFDLRAIDGGLEEMLAWWDRDERPRDRPFFLFLHTYAPHDPYGEKAQRDQMYRRDSPEAAEFAASLRARLERGETTVPDEDLERYFVSSNVDGRARATYARVLGLAFSRTVKLQSLRWLDEGLRTSPRREEIAEALRSAYVGGLPWVDSVFRRTMESLRVLPAGTVFVVASDHGEAFLEHGTVQHGRFLFDELVRVTLAIRAPGRLGPARRVRGSCGLVDVVPTLLELAGLPPAEGLDGRSLVPLSRGETGGHPVLGEEVREEFMGGGLAGTRLRAVRTDRAKLLIELDPKAQGPVETLHDLVADPGERVPLPAEGLDRFGPAFVDAVRALRALPP